MGLFSQNKFKYALMILLGLFVFLWYFSDALTPFIVGSVIAYLLDPLADRLEKLGVKRLFAVILICLLFLSILVFAVVFIFPIVFQQLLELFKAAPQYILAFQEYFLNNFPTLQNKTSIFNQSFSGFSKIIESKGPYLAQALVTSTVGIVNTFTFLLIVPVVTFYLLLDWNLLIEKVIGLVPKKYNSDVKNIAIEIDKTLASFVRGQLFICLILSIYYAVALMSLGVKFALLVGIIAGVFSLIPYVGFIFGGGIAIALAITQFWDDPIWIMAVGLIFLIGQVVEGNILSPVLIGRNIGLHPVSLLFSLSIFSLLFGFIGLLVAVPIAAIIGVLLRHSINSYKKTDFYNELDLD